MSKMCGPHGQKSVCRSIILIQQSILLLEFLTQLGLSLNRKSSVCFPKMLSAVHSSCGDVRRRRLERSTQEKTHCLVQLVHHIFEMSYLFCVHGFARLDGLLPSARHK